MGINYSDISEHLADMSGLDVSSPKITSVTDKLLREITEWRTRPLNTVYPIMFMDAMFFQSAPERSSAHSGHLGHQSAREFSSPGQKGHQDQRSFH